MGVTITNILLIILIMELGDVWGLLVKIRDNQEKEKKSPK